MSARSASHRRQRDLYLDGQLLVAMPAMGDPRFARSVIYLCAHSADGAMGIILNQRAPNISFTELLEQLNIVPPQDRIRLPSGLTAMAVHLGGPNRDRQPMGDLAVRVAVRKQGRDLVLARRELGQRRGHGSSVREAARRRIGRATDKRHVVPTGCARARFK